MGQLEGLERTLAQHPFFRSMNGRVRGLIAGCASHVVFRDGDYLMREGDAADTFYLIRHGAVALEVNAPGRQPLVIETLGDGEVLGWSWLIPPYRVQLDARSVGLTRLLNIDAACLRAKCDAEQELAYELYRHFLPVLSDRLAAARIQLLDMYGHPDVYGQTLLEPADTALAPARPTPEG